MSKIDFKCPHGEFSCVHVDTCAMSVEKSCQECEHNVSQRQAGSMNIIILGHGHSTRAIGKATINFPDIGFGIMATEPPKDEPLLYRRLPDFEQPPMISIKELEEPFYKRFDKRRGKRKNRR